MNTGDILNIVVSILTIAIAVVALFQTNKQITLSNKQHLFDRRLDKYLLVKDLIALYATNRESIMEKDLYMKCGLILRWLLNCKKLESMMSFIENPLNVEAKNNFLSKCEELEKAGEEIVLLWQEPFAETASQFVKKFCFLLQEMYKQHRGYVTVKKRVKEWNGTSVDVDTQMKKLAGKLFLICKETDSVYEKIVEDNIEQKMKSSLRL